MSSIAARPSHPVASRVPGTALMALLVLAASVAGCLAWTLHAGPDWSWDRVHYHEYAGWQVLEGALGRGFAPAGTQGFLNPAAFLPAQALARAGLDELGVALVMSVFHAAAVWLVWLASRAVLSRTGQPGQGAAEASALIAFLTPLYLMQVGTVSIDVLTALPVLAGVACALRGIGSPPRDGLRWTAAAGLAFGLAAGLKLSNAVPAVVGTLLIVWGASPRAWPARVAAYVAAGALGAAIAHGPWSVWLWAEYGSPVYPMFGDLFGTAPPPDLVPAPAAAVPPVTWLESLRAAGGRFTPRDLLDWIDFPLRVADPSITPAYAYIESRQPDPRLLLLAGATALAAIAALARRLRSRAASGGSAAAAVPGRDVDPGRSRLAALAGFWLVWYLAWSATSSNGRYAIALLMLASPLVVAALRASFPAPRVRAYAVLAAIVVQAVWALAVADPRTAPTRADWETGTLRVEMPAALHDAPTLQITRMAMSWSVLAPHLHPDATFATLGAACEGCGRGLDPDAVRRVLSEWRGRARMLDPVLGWADGRPEIAESQRSGIDAALAPYDLRVDPDDCEVIRIRPNPTRIQMRVREVNGNWSQRESDRLASCRVVDAPGAAERAHALATRVDPAFETIESRCAAVLGGPSGPTRWMGRGIWVRNYPRAALEIRVVDGAVTAFGELGQGRPLGRLAPLLDGSAEVDCRGLAPTQSAVWRAAASRGSADAAPNFDALVAPAAPAAPVSGR